MRCKYYSYHPGVITGVKLKCYFVPYYYLLHWAHPQNMSVGDLDFYILYIYDLGWHLKKKERKKKKKKKESDWLCPKTHPILMKIFIAYSLSAVWAIITSAEDRLFRAKPRAGVCAGVFTNSRFARRGMHLYAHDFAPLLGFLLYGTVWRKTTKPAFDLLSSRIWNFNRVCVLIFLSFCRYLVLLYRLNKK